MKDSIATVIQKNQKAIPYSPQRLICEEAGLCTGASSTSRSKSRKERKTSRVLIYGVPLIAVVLVGTGFALNLNRPPILLCSSTPSQVPATDFTVSLSVQVQNLEGNASRFLIPPGIGYRGGIWVSHDLDKYGIDGRSPLCTDPPSNSGQYQGYNLIHVRSNVNRTFTLGDFFNIWGEPLGPNGTFNPSYVLPEKNFQWEICIGNPNPNNTSNIKPGHWGNETMAADKFITLMYFPSNANGCLG